MGEIPICGQNSGGSVRFLYTRNCHRLGVEKKPRRQLRHLLAPSQRAADLNDDVDEVLIVERKVLKSLPDLKLDPR